MRKIAIRALAAMLLIPCAGGCISVRERVRRIDEPVGAQQVIEEQPGQSSLHASAELRGNTMWLQLDEQQGCSRKVEEQVQRTEIPRRDIMPGSLGCLVAEPLGALVLAGAALVALDPVVAYAPSPAVRLLYAMGLCGGSIALASAFAYQLWYLNDEGTRRSQTTAQRWVREANCATRPAIDTGFVLTVGELKLQGRTDAAGRAQLTAPDDENLRSLLKGAGWRGSLLVEGGQPMEVEIRKEPWRPGMPQGSVTPQLPATSQPLGQPASQPEPLNLGEQPPMLDAALPAPTSAPAP